MNLHKLLLVILPPYRRLWEEKCELEDRIEEYYANPALFEADLRLRNLANDMMKMLLGYDDHPDSCTPASAYVEEKKEG